MLSSFSFCSLRRSRRLSRAASTSVAVFDAPLKAAQRRRAAAGASGGGDANRTFDYLHDAVARRLVDRLRDVRRTFPTALDLGAGTGAVLRALTAEAAEAAAATASAAAFVADASVDMPADVPAQAPAAPACAGGIETLHMLEPEHARLYRDAANWARAPVRVAPAIGDEGGRLPYSDASLDMVISSCALHWQGDLPAVFAEVRRVLRPDGVFLAALLGGETLAELR